MEEGKKTTKTGHNGYQAPIVTADVSWEILSLVSIIKRVRINLHVFMQNPYHMTETVTENNNEKEDSTGYDNSLKLKNSGVNQS